MAPTESERRLERVLTSDPGMGVIRHADAGYEEAVRFAREHGIKRPIAGHRDVTRAWRSGIAASW